MDPDKVLEVFRALETHQVDYIVVGAIVDGVRVRVATPATLDRMKSGTVRLQDRADAARLREHFRLE